MSNDQRGTVLVVKRLISGVEGTYAWEGNCVECEWQHKSEGFAHDKTETLFMREVAAHSRMHHGGRQ